MGGGRESCRFWWEGGQGLTHVDPGLLLFRGWALVGLGMDHAWIGFGFLDWVIFKGSNG